jgi:hypothetical protein
MHSILGFHAQHEMHGSTATERVHDLDSIARRQRMFAVAATRHDLTIDLDGDAAVAEPFRAEKFQHGDRCSE